MTKFMNTPSNTSKGSVFVDVYKFCVHKKNSKPKKTYFKMILFCFIIFKRIIR